jgi:hypothetical protein
MTMSFSDWARGQLERHVGRWLVPPEELYADTIWWGGLRLPSWVGKYHYAINGTTRAGKSICVALYLKDRVAEIQPGTDRRLILFDPKYELHRILRTINPNLEIIYTLPTDRRASGWDPAKGDILTLADAIEFGYTVIPESGAKEPFFPNAVRDILIGVIASLQITHPGEWTLRQVFCILENESYLKKVLLRTPYTASKEHYWKVERTWGDIQATIESLFYRWKILAAFWDAAPVKFTVLDVMNRPCAFIQGSDDDFASVVDPFNAFLSGRVRARTLNPIGYEDDEDEDLGPRVIDYVIDEFTSFNGTNPVPRFRNFCEQGSSFGLRMAITYHSIADMKELYKNEAYSILGALQNNIFVRSGDVENAKFVSDLLGRERGYEEQVSETWGTSHSKTRQLAWFDREIIPYSELLRLLPPTPRNGLSAYAACPQLGNPWPFHITGQFIAANLPMPDPGTPRFVPHTKRNRLRDYSADMRHFLNPLEEDEVRSLRLRPGD